MATSAEDELIQQLIANGAQVRRTSESSLEVVANDTTYQVSLDNFTRRIGMGDAVEHIVADFVRTLLTPPPKIEGNAATTGLRLMLEQASVVEQSNTLAKTLSAEVVATVVWVDAAESRIRFVMPHHLAEWGLATDRAWSEAGMNMDELVRQTPIEVMDANGLLLGMLSTPSVSKASLLLAPRLRDFVPAQIGWPLLAVAPCRDFVYLLSETSRDQLGRMGPVVMREFTRSAYPLSPEVWRVSDDGLRSIGSFQPK